VSRQFVAASSNQFARAVRAAIGRSESRGADDRWHSLWRPVLVVALGIAEGGEKHVWECWQGATENTTVVKGLLEDLLERGLDRKRRYLVVMDGSKALRAGVERVFGEQVEVQRCRFTSGGM